MGIIVKKNKKGEYNLKCSMSDESLHPDSKWITENDAKRILIHRKFLKFIDESIEIDMCFPRDYHVNGVICRDDGPNKVDFLEWLISTFKSEDGESIIIKKFEEINKRLELDIKI